MLKNLIARYPKLATVASALLLVLSAAYKPSFLAHAHAHIVPWLAIYTDMLLPYLANLVIGGFFFLTAYLVYGPLESVTSRCLNKTSASERGKVMVSRSMQLIYWGLALFIGLSMLAPELLSKLFLGVSIFTAALALALKDIANDFISGVFLHFSPKFELGDDVTLLGTSVSGTVKGKITDIGYLVTTIETDDGVDVFANGFLWNMPLKVHKKPSA
ncbi:MAG TPA: mechanosensitive ion channel family protein [Chroococcales cyanobacterium]